MPNVVKCAICGIERRRLRAHLKASHGLTEEQYQQQYPGQLTFIKGSSHRSAECRRKQSEAATLRWAKPGEKEIQSERLKISAPWKGKSLSKSHRENISSGGLGVSHDLTPEQRTRMGEHGRLVLEDVRQRPGYSERLSEAQKRRVARGDRIGFQVPGVWKKAYQSKVRNGTLQAPGAGRGITGFREGIDHYCRSTLEANFARILVHEGIQYQYEPKVFVLPGGLRWTPDFLLHAPLLDLIPAGWVELKGWRKKDGTLPGNATQKVASFERHTGNSVFVLVQNEPLWEILQKRWSSLVPWEKPKYNLKTHPNIFGRLTF